MENYDKILEELGIMPPAPPKADALIGAADMADAALPPALAAPGLDWTHALLQSQISAEQARTHRLHTVIGWSVAGVLGVLVAYLLGSRKR